MKKEELKQLIQEVVTEIEHGGNLYDDMSQVERWLNSPKLQEFNRQVYADIMVAKKNGVSDDNIQGTIEDFLIEFEKLFMQVVKNN